MQDNCFSLIQTITKETKDFIVIFKDKKIYFTNAAFNSFFGASSYEDFLENFRSMTDLFVPHPSYFNAEKIPAGQTWFEAILALDTMDRVVSFLSQNHEPHAFSVSINEEVEGYKVVTFSDITQSLIKRILIENKMNIDAKSKAYTKQYFLHIKQSFEDAAHFNEKLIGLTLIELGDKESCEPDVFVETLKKHTRENDMIVAWRDGSFLIAYLIENAANANAVENKLRTVLTKNFSYTLSSILQKEQEKIAKMISRLEQN